MRGKKFFAILLLLIFSIPLIPIPQTGSFLSSGQLQEEIEDAPKSKEALSYDNGILHHADALPETDKGKLPLCLAVQVVSRQADDIFTPPPNA
jgi:hypothetical protein